MRKYEASRSVEQPAAAIESMDIDVDEQIDVAAAPAPNAFLQLLPRLLKKLESIVDGDSIKDDDVQLIEILSAVCLQAMLGSFMPKHILDTFDRVLNATQYWTQYRIARSASRQVVLHRKTRSLSMKYFHVYLQIRSAFSGGENLRKTLHKCVTGEIAFFPEQFVADFESRVHFE